MFLSYKFVTLFIFFQMVRGEENIVGQRNVVLKPMVSEECRKRGICAEVENYPTELAKRLIRELRDSGAIFSNIEEAKEDTFLTDEYPKITFRMDKDEYDEAEKPEETPLCDSTRAIEHPTYAENKNSTWHYILNDVEKPIQTFSVDRCNSENSPCSEKIKFMSNYESVCFQRWNLKEMYYIDKNEKTSIDYFKVPTCCSCKLRHINN
ncbi:neurotrophin 1-like [Melitaea cinxia]|uniref:neurotrophin 1-like n=1 Tax=Melitaea cinxia TaxID=113334 RepID=UPI001E27073E|nr:neurotrophin 1-like [Melitaea cinxia]